MKEQIRVAIIRVNGRKYTSFAVYETKDAVLMDYYPAGADVDIMGHENACLEMGISVEDWAKGELKYLKASYENYCENIGPGHELALQEKALMERVKSLV